MCVVAVVGACGKMGKLICEKLSEKGHDIKKVDLLNEACPSLEQLDERVDLVIDFSNKSQSTKTLSFCVETNTKLIMGTTGQDANFETELRAASKKIAVMKCDNFSENVAKFINLARLMSKNFEGEIAVVEAHHKNKADFPSGTSKQIVCAMLNENNNKTSSSSCQNFDNCVINTLSLRGGTLHGRHEVHFFDQDEEIILTHISNSRSPFINGLMKCVDFLTKENRAGLYSLDDVHC